MFGRGGFEFADLVVEFSDDGHSGAGSRSDRGGTASGAVGCLVWGAS